MELAYALAIIGTTGSDSITPPWVANTYPRVERVVQAAVKLIVEPIFEADFHECSYGFRPNRNAKMAVKKIAECCGLSPAEVKKLQASMA